MTFFEWLAAWLALEEKMQIAFAHGSFNVANTIIQFPLIGIWAMVVTKLIPGKDVTIEYQPKHLDPLFIQESPAVAIGQAKAEVVRTGEFAVQGMQEAFLYVQTGDELHAELAKQLEDAINHLDREITSYLVEISTMRISESDSQKHALLLDSIRDIERIGDHFDNIIGLTKSLHTTNKNGITEEAMAEMEKMFALTIETISKSIQSLQTNDLALARQVVEQEVTIDQMEYRYRKTHIDRLREGSCTLEAGMVYVDILSNLERSGDHAVNLAEVVLGKRL